MDAQEFVLENQRTAGGRWPLPGVVRPMVEREQKKRKMVVGKKGRDYIVLPLERVAYLYSKEKVAFAVDRESRHFILDGTLSELEQSLDGEEFYRINRQEIVHLSYIRSFRTFERVRVEIELELPTPTTLLVSQGIGPAFRKWIREK
jgi:DNA-binding LytR/AlgR family response regulator